MTDEEIERLYPEFDKWWRKEKGYLALGGVWLIKLWHEFLHKKGQKEIKVKPLEERQQREYERQEIIKNAVEVADRIILNGSDGSEAETNFLTARVIEKMMERALHPFHRNMISEDLKD